MGQQVCHKALWGRGAPGTGRARGATTRRLTVPWSAYCEEMSKNCVTMRIMQNGGEDVRKCAIFRVDHVTSKDEFSVWIGKKILLF